MLCVVWARVFCVDKLCRSSSWLRLSLANSWGSIHHFVRGISLHHLSAALSGTLSADLVACPATMLGQSLDLVASTRFSTAISDYFQWASLKNQSSHIYDSSFVRQLDADARHAFHLAYLIHVDIDTLFWSTQDEQHLREFLDWALNVRPFPVACIHPTARYCLKCHLMVPEHDLRTHLPLQELESLSSAHDSYKWAIPEVSRACSFHVKKLVWESNAGDSALSRLAYRTSIGSRLAICKRCSLPVMSEFLTLHAKDAAFCLHAKQAVAVSGGVLKGKCCRFGWYHGHPLLHHFWISPWKVLSAMLISRQHRQMQRCFHLALISFSAVGEEIARFGLRNILLCCSQSPEAVQFVQGTLSAVAGRQCSPTVWHVIKGLLLLRSRVLARCLLS